MSKTFNNNNKKDEKFKRVKFNSKEKRKGENKVLLEEAQFPFATDDKPQADQATKKTDTVGIKLKIDPEDGEDKTNYEEKYFKTIHSITQNGKEVIEAYYVFKHEIFNQQSMNDKVHVKKRVKMFGRIFAGEAINEYIKFKEDAKIGYCQSQRDDLTPEQREELLNDETLFYNYLEEDEDHCEMFERRLWFYMGASMWKNQHEMYREHIRYCNNHIVKMQSMNVVEHLKRVQYMFTIATLMQPPSRKGDTFDQAEWDVLKTDTSPEDVRRAAHAALPEFFKEQLRTKDKDWQNMEETEWIDTLVTIETTDKKQQDAKKVLKQKHDDNRKRTNDGGEEPSNKHVRHEKKTKTSNNNKSNSSSAAGVARYCVLCQKAGQPEWKVRNHNTNDCFHADDYAKRLSGGSKERNKAMDTHKKETRTTEKKYKQKKKELRSLQKAVKKSDDYDKIRKLQKKYAKEDSSDSEQSDSDSE
jgi:hypothetical protein